MKSRLKILLISHGIYPLDGVGGMELFTSEVAHFLAEENEITALIFKSELLSVQPIISRQKIGEIDVIHVSGSKDFKPHPAFTKIQFREVLQDEKPDLIYIVSPYLLPFQLMDESERLHVPWILHLNDFYLMCPKIKLLRPNGTLCKGPKRWRCTQCLKKITHPISFFSYAAKFSDNIESVKAVIRNARVVLCDSLHLARTYIKFGLALEQVINAPPILNQEIHFKCKTPAANILRIGFFGGPSPSKGLHILADALKRVQFPWQLIIYNVREEKNKHVLRLFKGAEDRITLHGAFTPDTLDDICTNLDVVAVPSIWHEAYGRVVDEALSRGVIVVASDMGGMGERLVDGLNAFLVPAGDSTAMAEKMTYIFSHLNDLHKSMKFDFGLIDKRNYSEKLKKICNAVANNRSVSGFLLDHELDILHISEVTGKSRNSIEERLLGELRNPGSTVNAAWIAAGSPKTASDIEAFYQSNDAYLYDLVVAHGTWERRKWRTVALSIMTKFGCKSVLDYGAGIGSDSLFFAGADFNVTYYDINEYCQKFSKNAANAAGLKLTIVAKTQTLSKESFDAVYCTEVLEHVRDPQGELERMCCLLKRGGYLLATESFGDTGERFLTHLPSNTVYAGRLASLTDKVGLSLCDVISIPGNQMYVFKRI